MESRSGPDASVCTDPWLLNPDPSFAIESLIHVNSLLPYVLSMHVIYLDDRAMNIGLLDIKAA